MRAQLERFLLAPAAARPFAALRIGLAAALLGQALQVAPMFLAFYHHGGLLRGSLMDAFAPTHLPPLGRLAPTLAIDGAMESLVLIVCGLLYVGSLVSMLVGWRTRAVTCSAWLLHWVFTSLAPHTNYGVDAFASVYLFYLLWAPAGAALSLDRRAGRASDRPRESSRLLLRVMQVPPVRRVPVLGRREGVRGAVARRRGDLALADDPGLRCVRLHLARAGPAARGAGGLVRARRRDRISPVHMAAAHAAIVDRGGGGDARGHRDLHGAPRVRRRDDRIDGLAVRGQRGAGRPRSIGAAEHAAGRVAGHVSAGLGSVRETGQ
jgi:hypothetical protein